MAVSLLFIFTGLILVLITDKVPLHLAFNELVGGSADTFFKYFTHVGDGLTVAIVIVLASLFSKEKIATALLGLISFALSGLFTQLLKRLVFASERRPVAYFGEDQLNLIEGVKMHGSHSFPSGHSTASFALFIFLAFVFRKYRYVQIFCAFGAILAAFSRVHLSQHFTEDVVTGSIIGVSVFFIVYWIFGKFSYTKKAQIQ